MTTAKDKRGGPAGRKTNQQIIEDFLHGLSLPPEVIEAIHNADPRVQVLPVGAPGSAAEMLELALPELWTAFQASKGIAKKHAFDAIAAAAKREEADGVREKEPEPLLADVVAGVVSLSPVRKRQILTIERARLDEEIRAVDGALASMNEVVAV